MPEHKDIFLKTTQEIEDKLCTFAKVSDATLSSGIIFMYVKDRVREVLNAIKAAGYAVIVNNKQNYKESSIEISCNKSMARMLPDFFEVEGFTIKVNGEGEGMKYNKLSFFVVILCAIAELDKQDGKVKTDGLSGGIFWSIPAIAYNKPASRSEFETRWALQIKDRWEPGRADRTSHGLTK